MRVHSSAILPGLLLAVTGLARPWLEATMAGHMVIELPMLFALGWRGAYVFHLHAPQPLPLWNASGMPAFFVTLLVTAFWMLPVALDLAVLDGRFGIIKVTSMVVAGAATGASWRRAGLIMQAFFVFNWVWMTITIGLLYQDAPQQLCSVYLSDQQATAGCGLVFLSLAVLIGWISHAFYLLSMQEDSLRQEDSRP